MSLRCESKERQDVVLQFLISLGVNEKTAEIDAEGIEHHVSHETLKAVRRFVSAPGRRTA